MQKSKFIAVVFAASLFIVGCTSANQPIQPDQETGTSRVVWCVEYTGPEECFEPIEFTEGQSAYDTLVALDEREDQFSFESTDYGPGVGQFVSAVNSVESTNESFWKLVYNDKDAESGISSIVAKDGDKFSLVYEEIE